MFALVLRFKAKTCNLRSWNFSSSRISRPARQDKNSDLNTNLSFNLFFCAVPQKYLSNFLKIKDWHIFNKQFITKFKRWCSNNWKDPTILTILISDHIWVKLPWTYIFPKNCHFFCNFETCFQALFALFRLFQLFLRVNHMCQSRENQVFDPSPQVRYLKSSSKHGQFWGL